MIRLLLALPLVVAFAASADTLKRNSRANADVLTCPAFPLSQGECIARIVSCVFGGPSACDPPLDSDGDGIIGSTDLSFCLTYPAKNTKQREKSCPAPDAEVCVERLRAGWASADSVDPGVDVNGDGILGGPDFGGCAVLPRREGPSG